MIENDSMKIFIANDHAGVEQKDYLLTQLQAQNISVEDLGTNGNQSVDYPDYAHLLAEKVLQHEKEGAIGILLCGSGNGVCITANKHQGIRAGLAWRADVAKLLKQHNNANVLCLPARFLTLDELWQCVQAFLETPFEGGRHQNRVDKIETAR